MMIMIYHATMDKFGKLGGEWAVSLFFVLSGFVSVISQNNKGDLVPSFKNNFKYMINKIKKLYPLYLISIFSLLVFDFIGSSKASIIKISFKLISNLLFIQNYFPFKSATSINGPSWFLCTIVLSYLLFPFIYKSIKNKYSLKRTITTIVILYALQFGCGIIGSYLNNLAISENSILSPNISDWFFYYFPPVRLIDVVIGNYLGFIFINNKKESLNKATLKEILLLIISIVAIIVGKTNENATITTWWDDVVLYTPISVLLIWVFAHEQGVLSKTLTNKPILFVASISPYGFLIHYPVFKHLDRFVSLFYNKGYKIAYYLCQYSWVLKCSIGITITILLCVVWMKIQDKYFSKKIN